MERHQIPTASHKSFIDFESARDYVKSVDPKTIVIKASGLAAGKGVILPETFEEAENVIREVIICLTEEKKINDLGKKNIFLLYNIVIKIIGGMKIQFYLQMLKIVWHIAGNRFLLMCEKNENLFLEHSQRFIYICFETNLIIYHTNRSW